ncbi:MAG: T9SS type A sorting domain-containing protein [Saprospiraceae bacterium]
MKHTLPLLLLFLSGLFFPTFSQSWTKVQQWGGTGTEICSGLATGKDGAMVVSGSFEKQISFDNKILTALGEEDIFIGKLKSNLEIAWVKQAGSRLEDEVAALTLDSDDNLVITGTYWQESNFDHIKLTAGENPKAIFIAKYDFDGNILWAKTLNGNGLKGVEAVACDAENNILLTGFFEKNLLIGDTAFTARGNTDLFLAKFSSNGHLLWAVQQGKKGDTRGTALGLLTNGDIVVAGFYNDSTQIADTILTANTSDQDAFIARFDKNGAPLWAKKAGGVFDSDVTKLVMDEADNIYITGYFVGVMRLSPTLSIQSSTGNSDCFLLKYQADGTPLAARAFGGRLLEQAADLMIQNNMLFVCGFYQGDLVLDGFSLSTGNALSGFVAGFDLNLRAKWLKNLASDTFLYASNVVADAGGNILIGGSFIGKATLDSLQLNAATFDLFLARATFDMTSTRGIKQSGVFQVFPNPTAGKVFIQTEETQFYIQVVDNQGKIILNAENLRSLDFFDLPKGNYFITFRGNFTSQTFKMIWN